MLKQVQHDVTSNGHFNKAKRRRNLLNNLKLPFREASAVSWFNHMLK